VRMQEIPGNGHTGLPDRDKIKEMYRNVRDPVPAELTWLMTDKVIKDFYWLHVPNPSRKQEIDALCHDNHITITTSTNVTGASVLLDGRLIDFDKSLTLEVNGTKLTRTFSPASAPSARLSCAAAIPNWPSPPKSNSPSPPPTLNEPASPMCDRVDYSLGSELPARARK